MARIYTIKEIFRTLQGEGANTGLASVFVRFAGCNLWSGVEVDRSQAICQFCDTDFFRGNQYTAEEIVGLISQVSNGVTNIVCTGGEPLLQLDGCLVDLFRKSGYRVLVETNGTIATNLPLDWICVSPKYGSLLKQLSGNELKVVFPQDGLLLEDLEKLDFTYRFVQPKYNSNYLDNLKLSIEFCLEHPSWRLSIQTHKIIGLS